MCTAVTWNSGSFYFGRTLDLEFPFSSEIVITPRNFPLPFRHGPVLDRHYAIVGMAQRKEGYPLYFDGVNEKGLGMAGLDFSESARYDQGTGAKICHFELIPWVLGQCACIDEAWELLSCLCLCSGAFRSDIPESRLHWIIADREQALTLESTEQGLRVYSNPVGVLTNEPPFEFMLHFLNRHLNLSPYEPENRFSPRLDLRPDSHGMGAMGLPGDMSSPSRFVRAAFSQWNALPGKSEEERVGQFFHIMDSVAQTRGLSLTEEGKPEHTLYTSCCNADRGIYYYTTYENRQISAVDLYRVDLDGSTLTAYPLIQTPQIRHQN